MRKPLRLHPDAHDAGFEGGLLTTANEAAASLPLRRIQGASNTALVRRVGGGQWVVSKVALAMFLDGDDVVLTAHKEGNRSNNCVVPCFRREGLEGLLENRGNLVQSGTTRQT